ncbi:acetyl-CoA carboxylase (plasmid) [Haloferacaceae archaeon DSL9]
MSNETTIAAPMPGVFYRRPDPDEAFFVEEGDEVAVGDVVCLVGVMKNFHEITSDVDGVVEEILVEDESAIDAGQELIRIQQS